MLDWRTPASVDAKLQLLRDSGIIDNWGEERDTYLWFLLGPDVTILTSKELATIGSEFFPEGTELRGGDIELQVSRVLDGEQRLLRVRGQVMVLPGIAFRNTYCPLYQYGHNHGAACINFSKVILRD